MERGSKRSTSCIIGKVNRVELLPDTGHFSYCPPRCGFIIYRIPDRVTFDDISNVRVYTLRIPLRRGNYNVDTYRYGREIRTDRPINRASIELIDRLESRSKRDFNSCLNYHREMNSEVYHPPAKPIESSVFLFPRSLDVTQPTSCPPLVHLRPRPLHSLRSIRVKRTRTTLRYNGTISDLILR